MKQPPTTLMTALALLACACGPEKGETTSSGPSSSSSASTSGSSTSEEPTTATTMGFGCSDPPPDDGPQCAAQADRASCEATDLAPSSDVCLWIPWFPVTLVDDTCTFGAPVGQCAHIPCSGEGCATLTPCNAGGYGGAFLVGEDDQISVGFADWCVYPPAPAESCIFDNEGKLLTGPPECACLCDPAFPPE